MLLHVSIPADNPEHVARVLAEVCAGTVLPFVPVAGAFMVWLGDVHRSIIEVNPRGHEHVPAPGQFGIRPNATPSPYSEAHIAFGTSLSADEVLAIGKRERWLAQRSDRGGLFSVVELWAENKFLLEVLTEGEQRRYAGNLSLDLFREMASQAPDGDTV